MATVGTCDVHPGAAVNSVPSRVTLQLDIRDTDPARRESVMQAVRADIASLSQRRHVTITETLVNADAPAQSDPHIIELLEQTCRTQNLPYKKMVSRAYHDSLFMARLAPIAMLFIPLPAPESPTAPTSTPPPRRHSPRHPNPRHRPR